MNSVNAYESHHLFSNRLYISEPQTSGVPSAGEIRGHIISKKVGDPDRELVGAGVRSYSKPIGWVLSLFGFASKLNFGSDTQKDVRSFYVNNKSFSKYIIRREECAKKYGERVQEAVIKVKNGQFSEEDRVNENVPNPKTLAERMDNLFFEHLDKGYDNGKVQKLNTGLKNLVHEKPGYNAAYFITNLRRQV